MQLVAALGSIGVHVLPLTVFALLHQTPDLGHTITSSALFPVALALLHLLLEPLAFGLLANGIPLKTIPLDPLSFQSLTLAHLALIPLVHGLWKTSNRSLDAVRLAGINAVLAARRLPLLLLPGPSAAAGLPQDQLAGLGLAVALQLLVGFVVPFALSSFTGYGAGLEGPGRGAEGAQSSDRGGGGGKGPGQGGEEEEDSSWLLPVLGFKSQEIESRFLSSCLIPRTTNQHLFRILFPLFVTAPVLGALFSRGEGLDRRWAFAFRAASRVPLILSFLTGSRRARPRLHFSLLLIMYAMDYLLEYNFYFAQETARDRLGPWSDTATLRLHAAGFVGPFVSILTVGLPFCAAVWIAMYTAVCNMGLAVASGAPIPRVIFTALSANMGWVLSLVILYFYDLSVRRGFSAARRRAAKKGGLETEGWVPHGPSQVTFPVEGLQLKCFGPDVSSFTDADLDELEARLSMQLQAQGLTNSIISLELTSGCVLITGNVSVVGEDGQVRPPAGPFPLDVASALPPRIQRMLTREPHVPNLPPFTKTLRGRILTPALPHPDRALQDGAASSPTSAAIRALSAAASAGSSSLSVSGSASLSIMLESDLHIDLTAIRPMVWQSSKRANIPLSGYRVDQMGPKQILMVVDLPPSASRAEPGKPDALTILFAHYADGKLEGMSPCSLKVPLLPSSDLAAEAADVTQPLAVLAAASLRRRWGLGCVPALAAARALAKTASATGKDRLAAYIESDIVGRLVALEASHQAQYGLEASADAASVAASDRRQLWRSILFGFPDPALEKEWALASLIRPGLWREVLNAAIALPVTFAVGSTFLERGVMWRLAAFKAMNRLPWLVSVFSGFREAHPTAHQLLLCSYNLLDTTVEFSRYSYTYALQNHLADCALGDIVKKILAGVFGCFLQFSSLPRAFRFAAPTQYMAAIMHCALVAQKAGILTGVLSTGAFFIAAVILGFTQYAAERRSRAAFLERSRRAGGPGALARTPSVQSEAGPSSGDKKMQ